MLVDNHLMERIGRNDPQLTVLDLSNKEINPNDLEMILKIMESNTHITTLNVSNNDIGNHGAELLASANCTFTTLIASSCKFTSIESLAKTNRLISLNLADNEIVTSDISLLAESLTLTSLSLAGNDLSDRDAIELAKSKSITSMILSHNTISDSGAIALSKSHSLVEVNLSENNITTSGVIALSKSKFIRVLSIAGNSFTLEAVLALSKNTTLTKLDVSSNKIVNESAMALLQHSSLIELDMSYNKINFDGDYVLEKVTPLKKLIVSHNLIKDPGIIMLAKHHALTYLDASGNQANFKGVYALSLNTTLLTLAYSSNSIKDAGGVCLAQNETLQELFLSYNDIEDAGAIALAENKSIKILNLNYNKVGPLGKKALLENTTITKLILSPEQPPEFSNANLDTIFSLASDFICICNSEGTLQYFNPAFSKILGYSQDELLGQSLHRFLHPQDAGSLQQQLDREEKIPIYDYENRYLCKDGSYRIILWSSYLKHDRLYAMGKDVSKQRKAERQNITIRMQQTVEYNQQLTEFIAFLSHEVRNPLNNLYGLMETLKEQIKSQELSVMELTSTLPMPLRHKFKDSFDEITQTFNSMLFCANYQTSILDNNLEIINVKESGLLQKTYIFELNKTIQDLFQMNSGNAKLKHVELKIHLIDENEIWLEGDELALKQIIVNLLENALKFTEVGSVELSVMISDRTADNAKVVFKLKDTSAGFDETELGQLFQRFSHVNISSGADFSRTAFGLYLAKILTINMGGDITVTSQKDKGSEFILTLPFIIPSIEKVNEMKEKFTQLISPIATLSESVAQKRILIVEDNVVNQKFLKRMLSKAGHDCDIANNGVQALEAFQKLRYDVILMDVIMPVMGGIEATIKIRQIERERKLIKTPIFALTANSTEQDQKIGMSSGMDQYFTKPINQEMIVQAINILPNINKESRKESKPVLGTFFRSGASQLSSVPPDEKHGNNILVEGKPFTRSKTHSG